MFSGVVGHEQPRTMGRTQSRVVVRTSGGSGEKNMRQDARTRDATRAPWIQRHGAKQLHREDWNIDKQSRQVVRIHTPLHLKS